MTYNKKTHFSNFKNKKVLASLGQGYYIRKLEKIFFSVMGYIFQPKNFRPKNFQAEKQIWPNNFRLKNFRSTKILVEKIVDRKLFWPKCFWSKKFSAEKMFGQGRFVSFEQEDLSCSKISLVRPRPIHLVRTREISLFPKFFEQERFLLFEQERFLLFEQVQCRTLCAGVPSAHVS